MRRIEAEEGTAESLEADLAEADWTLPGRVAAALGEGGLARWLYSNCQLGNTVGVGRIDFRQQYLQVFRCPPRNVADR